MAFVAARSVRWATKLGLGFLAVWAEESAALVLNDAQDLGFATAEAILALSGVDGMVVLVLPFPVDGISISAIPERGTFAHDGGLQNFEHGTMDFFPLRSGEFAAQTFRMDHRSMKDFGSVEIADTCDAFLIEQGGFDGTSKWLKADRELGFSDLQCVGTEDIGSHVVQALRCIPEVNCS